VAVGLLAVAMLATWSIHVLSRQRGLI
jgi:hypothetical protein